MERQDLTYQVIGAAVAVHSELGPGLMESAYQRCLEYEMNKRGLTVHSEVKLPINYGGIELQVGYRVDLIVENQLIIEVKAVSSFQPIHQAQVITYLKLSGLTLGLLINFNEKKVTDGIKRIIHSGEHKRAFSPLRPLSTRRKHV